MPTIDGNFEGKHILSIEQFLARDIQLLFTCVEKIKKTLQSQEGSHLLSSKLVTLLFFEPSSRTFGSFSAALKRLGAQTIDIQNPSVVSSLAKGETLSDTVRVFEHYSDMIIIRTKEQGEVHKAAKAAFLIPIINAGDGPGEHPTQALLDLYTIYDRFGTLDNVTGVVAGDVKNSRTVHSLLLGLSLFPHNTVYLLSSKELALSQKDLVYLQTKGLTLLPIESEQDIPKDVHFWYWTRIQKERFKSEDEYKREKKQFVITNAFLEQYGNKEMIILHPLPRIDEINREVDNDKRAVYFTEQIKNGLHVRMALLAMIFGKI